MSHVLATVRAGGIMSRNVAKERYDPLSGCILQAFDESVGLLSIVQEEQYQRAGGEDKEYRGS